MSAPPHPPQSTGAVAAALFPVIAAVLAGYLVVGAALPVLPLYVHQNLGFGTFAVGVVAGTQFAASLASRVWAGSRADARGGKHSVLLGLGAASASGLLYLLSSALEPSPRLSLAALLAGRVVLGAAESLIITAGVIWGLVVAGAARAGLVIAWAGTALFTALALGGPIGTMLFASSGLAAIALLTCLLPLAVLLLLLRAPDPHRAQARQTASFGSVIGATWLPGTGAALASTGYGAVLAFSSLLYAQNGWQPVWLAFSAFGGALVVARLLFGHLPDRLGGARTALLFVFVQIIGLVLMWLAPDVTVSATGAAIAGLGYSLVFPGLGVEAVRHIPPASHGLAMGIYTAFLDVALAVASPALGWIADRQGTAVVFLVAAGLAAGTALIAARILLAVR